MVAWISYQRILEADDVFVINSAPLESAEALRSLP